MLFNKKNIINFIENDKQLLNTDATVLKNLVDDSPYSSVLQLLYAKYLHLHNDSKLEQQLENCAITISNRKKVYNLLFNSNIEPNEKDSSAEEVIVLEKTTPTSPPKEVVIETHKEIDELEKDILAQAVNSSLQIEISNYALSEEKNNPESNENLNAETQNATEIDKERSFLNWFEKPITKSTQPKSSSLIIEDFLKTPKKVKKEPQEKLSGSSLAQLSLIENNQIVTETLATIYAKQGQIEKAIEIYNQLSLKIPEKKTFFASRIRFLKDKQQYNK